MNLSRGFLLATLLFLNARSGFAAASSSTIKLSDEPASPEVILSSASTTIISSTTVPVVLSTSTAFDRRLIYERFARRNPFVLLPHRQNYLLPLAYNFNPDLATFDTGNAGGHPQNMELKFQISFKVNLIRDLIYNRADLYTAYTQQSYWQAYNTRNSSPFRETNYEPEAGMVFYDDLHFLGIRSRIITLAISHQSNGRSGTSSRSWNRVFSEIMFEHRDMYLTLRPWYRFPEPASTDDNPDIEKYLGYGELYVNYVYKKYEFGVMTRNNCRSDNKGAVQVDWSFPLVNLFKGYVQYFYGYGESLIDYNHINQRLSVGLMLSNWI